MSSPNTTWQRERGRKKLLPRKSRRQTGDPLQISTVVSPPGPENRSVHALSCNRDDIIGKPILDSPPRRRGRKGSILKSLPLNDSQFRIAVGVGAAVLVLVILRIRFCYDLELPDAPPPPAALTSDQAAESLRSLEYSPAAYEKHLLDDSRAAGIDPPATIARMSREFIYKKDAVERTLQHGDTPIDAVGLRLRLVVQDIRGTHRRQMVLEIENRTEHALAYRIQTQPTKGTKPCHNKEDIGHNAMAIAPGTSELRSECTYRSGWGLKIQSVETIRLPELAFIYVSWVMPSRIGMDRRATRGHRPIGSSSPCEIRLAANIENGLQSGEISWRDVVDFYARHRCPTYSFPYGYKAFEKEGDLRLPVAHESY